MKRWRFFLRERWSAWKLNQQCYHPALFLLVIHLLHPFWSNIYPLYGASPSADLVCNSSYMEKLRSPAACCIYFGVPGKAKLPKSSHPTLSHHILLPYNLAGVSLGEKEENQPNSTTGSWDALGAASRAWGWDDKACACGPPLLIARAEAKSAGNRAFLGLKIQERCLMEQKKYLRSRYIKGLPELGLEIFLSMT